MAGKKTSKGKELFYARYKSSGTYAKNKKARIARAIKRDPNNAALKNHLLDINYSRKTPGADTWSASGIALAKIFKEFCGNFNKGILSSNPKQASEALHALASKCKDFSYTKDVLESVQYKRPFSIEARARF